MVFVDTSRAPLLLTAIDLFCPEQVEGSSAMTVLSVQGLRGANVAFVPGASSPIRLHSLKSNNRDLLY